MQAEIEHLKLHLPVIALDGAILYDVPKMNYFVPTHYHKH